MRNNEPKHYLKDGLNEFSPLMLDELNVGLLAAKVLDNSISPTVINYANKLHTVWHQFLSFVGQPVSTATRGNLQLAYDFYNQTNTWSHDKILSHIQGIDFNKAVNVVSLTRKTLCQWAAPSEPQGYYYGEIGSHPGCLGIYHSQGNNLSTSQLRQKTEYRDVRDDILSLQSTARDVIDTWSIKNVWIWASGGCTQYFCSITLTKR